MANSDIARMSKRVVQYFWDPPPRNEDADDIWCLGRSYKSQYKDRSHSQPATGTSPSAKSESAISQADSAIVTDVSTPIAATDDPTDQAQSQPQTSLSEEEAAGWPTDFLSDLDSRVWLTYRNNFPPIAKSNDPNATSAISFSTKLRNLGNQGGFTSDTGWGCMIRSGQSLLANTLVMLQLGRDWKLGEKSDQHKRLIAAFADQPEAPFSIHNFVAHGAEACGKHPGEWFGPSATARCIKALAEKHDDVSGLRVYVRPDDSDVYIDQLISTSTQKSADDIFQPVLILLGTRLGINRVTPVYHAVLKKMLELPQSVGIAGGRPSSSHYFVGYQGDNFFYLDPHATRSAIPLQPSDEDVASCHTRRVRRIHISEMDPSMLLGFLLKSREDLDEWREAVVSMEGTGIVHIHDKEPRYSTGPERAGAVDEVESWDETGDDENE